jgi:hypothetical protein
MGLAEQHAVSGIFSDIAISQLISFYHFLLLVFISL